VSLTGSRVQSKLGDIECVIGMWLLNQLTFVTAGAIGVNGIPSITYVEGVASTSVGVWWPAIPELPSDVDGLAVVGAMLSMLGTGMPEIAFVAICS
jgi:hypothetical protein